MYHTDYEIERKDRIGKSGGGILCYIHDSLVYKRRHDLEHPDIEMILIEIVFSSSKNILVGVFYRAPNSCAKWLKTFSEHLEKMYDTGKEIVLMGDMNIDLMNHNVNNSLCSGSAKKLVKMLENVRLNQIICDPTRVTSHSKTLIDHVYVSDPTNIIHSCVPVYAASDHYPVCITRKFVKSKQNSGKQICYRNMKNFDEDAFMSDMFNAAWQEVNACKCPDDALTLWSSKFQDIVDKHMPVIHKRVKRVRQPKWLTTEIQDAIHTRDFLKKTNNSTGYKTWRNKVVNMIRKAKKAFYVEAIESNKRNPTVLWKHMKGVCPDKQEKAPKILQTEDKTITDNVDIANALNTYFASVSDKYVPVKTKKLDNESSANISEFVNEKVERLTKFTVPPVTTDFVLKE